MFRRLLPVCVILATLLAAGRVRAQMPFSARLIPTRTALDRLGLERQWFGVVPLVESERLLKITLDKDRLFAQTNYAMLHTFDAESGRLLWSAPLGERTGFARGVAANSFEVFVTNADTFFGLDRTTGRPVWQVDLGTIPTSSPACDEERAMVGLTTGKIYAYKLKSKDEKGNETILSPPPVAWNWQTGGPMTTRPLPATNVVAFGGSDGKAYVVMAAESTPVFRVGTGGPIGKGMGGYGTRTLLVPSADNNLYAIDLFRASVSWTFPSGAPIDQEPLVAGGDVYIVNTAGSFSSLDPETGSPRWATSTQGGRLISIGPTKIYLRAFTLDLFVVDRKTGRTLVSPNESLLRAGLNIRDYDMDVVNRFNDRLYVATSSGMIVCLRESANVQPQLLRDPKAHPFGFIPPEGLKAPAAPGAAEPKIEVGFPGEEPAERPKAKPAAEKDQEKEKPAEEKEKAKDKPDAEKDEPKG
jgi:outer membrane protein assembly factor BamB